VIAQHWNPNLHILRRPDTRVGPRAEPLRAVLLSGDPLDDDLELVGRAINREAARRAARVGPDGCGGWVNGIVAIDEHVAR